MTRILPMTKSKKNRLVLFLIVMMIGSSLYAGDRGTADEAKALLQKAVEHYKQVGRDQAMKDFTGAKAPWVDRDLYVACSNSKHILISNGRFPSYVGSSIDAIKDDQGKPFGQSSWDAASKGGVQSVEWKWFNPISGKLEPKVSFVQKVDEDVVCAVGYYKPE